MSVAELTREELVQAVAEKAEEMGVNARSFMTSPATRRESGFGDELTETICDAADRLIRKMIDEMMTRYGQRRQQATATVRKQQNRRSTKRVKIWGKYSPTSILRWMGQQDNWSIEDAGVALTTLGAAHISDNSIKFHMWVGKNKPGKYGPAAPITESERKKLRIATK